MNRKIRCILFTGYLLLMFTACNDNRVTKLLYQGHASFRFTAKNGTVVYIDPYAGDGYDVPADIILVTHGHADHNRVELVTQKKGCVVITNEEALTKGTYNTFTIKGVKIEPVEAYNGAHHRSISVGYIITIDGIKVYHTGDTGKTDQMSMLSEKNLDYALMYCDGIPELAADWAEIIGVRYNIPMHTNTNRGILLDRSVAERFSAPNRIIIEPGEEIEL